MPLQCAPLTYRPSRASKLPSLETPLSAREARKVKGDPPRFHGNREAASKLDELEAGYPALPSALGAALGNPVSLLALEDWHKTHSGLPEEHGGFESRLLACEARFRKIERLTARVELPDTAVTAVVVDLLREVVDTLPVPIRQIASDILQHVECAIYSGNDGNDGHVERLPKAEKEQLAEVLGPRRPGRGDLSELQPWFAVVRRQQATLERMEQHVAEMQGVVDFHLGRRKSVLDFIVRLQGQERFILQQWLFNFWVFSYRERKARMEKMSQSVLATGSEDMVTPFLSWRLYVAQQRLVRAKEKCSEVDRQASVLANKITEVEMENQEQQRILEESLAAGAELKEKCMVEQQELSRLKQIWSDTQPELLLQVLAQSLELFFSLVVRQAGLHHLEVKHRLAKKDIRPLLDDPSTEAETVLMRWINVAVTKARAHCEELLGDMSKEENQDALILVARQEEIQNLDADLSDGVALSALYAMIKAEREQKGFSVKDLIALSEVDPELRSVQLCYCLLEISPSERAKCLLVPQEIAQGDTEKLQLFLAAVFAMHPMLEDLPVAMNNLQALELQKVLYEVLDKMEDFAGNANKDALEDPTPLLHGGEETQALATISVEQILLRWVNAQLALDSATHSRPVENFASDLQDGVALAKLLTVIAPEACVGEFSETREERLEQIIVVAGRCSDYELLTVNAVVEGQSDMLACFLAQLMLVRPNLAAQPDSLLSMHLQSLEEVCSEGLMHLTYPHPSTTMKICLQLEECWTKFKLAAQAVQECTKCIAGIKERVHAFLGETLSHRARGQPKTMLDAKESREFLFYTSLNPERLTAMNKELILDKLIVDKVEDILRRHFRLLREIFKHYSSSKSGGSNGVDLKGLLKLFQECKLRSKEFAPFHLETIFNNHLEDKSRSGDDRSLAPHEFIEVLILCAFTKFRQAASSLSEQMLLLIDLHLKPNACNDAESMFQKMAYSSPVRQVLDQHQKELFYIFQLYAFLDMSTTEAMQKENTMNITEFQMLLEDCGFLDLTLTEAAVQQIFQGIQQNATAEEGAEEAAEVEGVDDDEEMSFSEFLDGLVAVAAYKFPDPFTPLSSRINTFLLQLFASIRKHWSRKRGAPRVDMMLNALQKKMR